MDRQNPAQHGSGHVAVVAQSGAAVATVGWRRQGQLFITVVVKGTFTIVPDGPMTLAPPEPIVRDEQLGASGSGLQSAGDLAPYLGHTDICLIGHMTVPAGRSSAVVRLGLFRERAVLLDARAEIPAVPAGPRGVARADLGEAMGPISKNWPARRRLLGSLDHRALEGDILEIPEVFDWSYFQASPPEMRTEMLRGDEWIGLFDPRAEVRPLRAHLPGAQGAARLYVRSPAPRPARPIRLSADSLVIDVDRMICTILWRGHFQPPADAELSDLCVAAGIELPGRTLVWTNPFTADARSSDRIGKVMEAEPVASIAERTIAVSPLEDALRTPVRPSSSPPRRSSSTPPPDVGTTMTLSADDAILGAARPATPFEGAAPQHVVNPAVGHPALRPPAWPRAPSGSPESAFGETMDLSSIMHEMTRRAAPFPSSAAAFPFPSAPTGPSGPEPNVSSRSSPPGSSSSRPPAPPAATIPDLAPFDGQFGGTMDLGGAVAHGISRPDTPFRPASALPFPDEASHAATDHSGDARGRSAPLRPASEPPGPRARHFGETADLSPFFAHGAETPTTPFRRIEAAHEVPVVGAKPPESAQSAAFPPIAVPPPFASRPAAPAAQPTLSAPPPAQPSNLSASGELDPAMSLGAMFLAAIAEADVEAPPA